MAGLLLRVVLLAAGLVFAASLAVALVLVLGIWLLRAAWSKITGRPVTPFVVRIHPRSGFDGVYRRARAQGRTSRADSMQPGRNGSDVTDVEPKEPRG